MKYIWLILLMALPCFGDYYYAKVETNTLAVMSDWKTDAPVTKVLYGKRVIVPLTEQEYVSKVFGDMTARVATALANRKDKESEIDEVSPETMKAMLKAMVKVINLRLPEDRKITAKEMKAAIKKELP